MAAALNTAGLAQVLRGCDTARPSTEDKLQCTHNFINMFAHLAPALVHGNVHTSILHLLNSSDREWECYQLALGALRALVEGCANTPAAMDTFDPESLAAVAEGFARCLEQEVAAGLGAERAQAVANSLAGCTLLRLTLLPASAYGHQEGRYDEGMCSYLESMASIVRVLGCLAQDRDIPEGVRLTAQLLEEGGVYRGLKPLLQNACDLMYARKYYAAYEEQCMDAGAPLLRNVLALVCMGVNPAFLSQAASHASSRQIVNTQGGPLHSMESQRLLAQTAGPDGQPLSVFEVSLAGRDYTKDCAACGRKEGEVGVHLRQCAGCPRERYCCQACQKRHWPEHKAACKRYQRRQEQQQAEGTA